MADNFYSSTAWLKARAKVLKRDNYSCVLCNTSVHGKGASRVDHIQARRDYPDLALNVSNLRTLCVTCDNMQSIDRGQRFGLPPVEGVNEDGYPARWTE